jgi:MFS family permease
MSDSHLLIAAFGPLMVGPLSEIYGRNLVYRISYLVFFLFSFPVAFSTDIGTFIIITMRNLES